jgi:hypothetical protein
MWWLSWVGAGLPVARRVLSGVVGRVVGVRLLMMIFVFYTTVYKKGSGRERVMERVLCALSFVIVLP